ncbi:unnamed protein product [Effrenium voratum]|nr:unnamed protein product [Effrenium voratum]
MVVSLKSLLQRLRWTHRSGGFAAVLASLCTQHAISKTASASRMTLQPGLGMTSPVCRSGGPLSPDLRLDRSHLWMISSNPDLQALWHDMWDPNIAAQETTA